MCHFTAACLHREKCHYSGISGSYVDSPWVPQQQFQKDSFSWRGRQLNKQGGFLVTSAKDPAKDDEDET